jgi:hypothetical protein
MEADEVDRVLRQHVEECQDRFDLGSQADQRWDDHDLAPVILHGGI